MRFVLRASAILIGLVLVTLLPFAPGRHDASAVALSMVAQGLGWGSLLLVPVGVAWLIHGSRQRSGEPAAGVVRHRYTVAALVLLGLVGLLAVLIVAAQSGFSLGILLGFSGAFILGRAGLASRGRARTDPAPGLGTAALCIVVPIAYVLAWILVAEPAERFARERAIENSAELIADIERFRASRGHYPPSLHSEWEDYDPSVVGIDRYRYEPHGEAYNLFFEQPSFTLGARVFVMYNPLGEQALSAHNSDLLRLAPEDLELQRGFLSAEDLPQAHWKSFLFD
jgi:hypothetical protein